MELVQTLRQTTRLAMTQHMQQSLQVLQMSTAELVQFLEEKIEENPCLQVSLPRPRPRDVGPRPELGLPGGDYPDPVARLDAPGQGLYSTLSDRIERSFTDPRLRAVAFGFLERLEPSGWLSASVDEVALATGVPEPVAGGVLERLQAAEPAGLFARSLAECLRLQAKAADVLTWELATLIDNLPLLAEGRLADLAMLCDCEPGDIAEIAAQLRAFDPKPGLQFDNDLPPVFPPDLSARRGADGWEVALTRSNLPTLTVVEAVGDAEALRAARAEAQALAAALEKRQATLLRVGAAMVRHQGAYFDRGPGHLRPLTLDMLAAELGLHASTISRVCAGRMIDGPRGALPLKALFSRPLDGSRGGTGPSQDALSDAVRRIIAAETPGQPLSDAAIVEALKARQLRVARRTVAKYREALGIPSSSVRRRQAQG